VVRKLIDWAVANPFLVLLGAVALAVGGGYAFHKVNVEAYPDPAPAIVEVVAQFPGASAEEVERQVTIPLEVSLQGMPALQTIRSKSLFGLSHLRIQFEYGREYDAAKQDVINRLAMVQLPNNIQPQLSPQNPIGEILRYTLENPRDADGNPVYTLADLKALQEYTVQRALLRVPRIGGVTGAGGLVKRYEVNPDPDRLRAYQVTLAQLQTALGNANANGSGDNLRQGEQTLVVRSLGLFGGGQDPQQQVLGMTDPALAAAVLRAEEAKRCREIRQVVVQSTNNVPVRIDNLVDGGPVLGQDGSQLVSDRTLTNRGVVVGFQTRQGRVAISRPLRARPWAELTPAEQARVRGQSGWSDPPKPTLWDRARRPFAGRPAESGDPAARVWWLDEREVWQGRPAGARRWAELGPTERGAAAADLAGRLPTEEWERGGWRVFTTLEGRWDGWDDARWADEDDVVQGIVLLRKGQESLPALRDVVAKIDELNRPGNLLPGVKIVPYYNRTDLINKTTETVEENLLMGMALVTAVLFMFLGNVRAAVIVAINIPLALLFAFGVLYARGKSANLLSIGAVDFGIIVDSSVIVVESIFRHLSKNPDDPRPLRVRIGEAAGEVQRSLFFATLVMVCALLPLFTMTGPEGQIFGPMADTYAFALAGALFLALTVSPVLCLLLFKNLKPKRDNILVRGVTAFFLWQLRVALRFWWAVIAGFLFLLVLTGATAASMGREFMPELEEGNLFLRGTFPVSVAFDHVAARSRQMRGVLRDFPECAVIVPMIGRPDDGTDPTGYYNVEVFIPLRPEKQWPADPARGRPRTKPQLIRDMTEALEGTVPGVEWDFSQIIRDNVMEALSGVKGENSVKIIGPDLGRLEQLAVQTRDRLERVPGVDNPGVFRIQGQSNLEFPVDRRKAAYWGVNPSDIQLVVQTAVGGKAATTMIEGGKTFDVTLRFPFRLRGDEQSILNVPVQVTNQVTATGQITAAPSPVGGSGTGLTPSGTTVPPPSPYGSQTNVPPMATTVPTRRLADLVSPPGKTDRPEDWMVRPGLSALVGGWVLRPEGSFLRPGASTIYREQGQRLIAVKFGVRDRDLAGAVGDAKGRVDPLFQPPYRAEWSGEYQEMEEAEARLAATFGISFLVILAILYTAFRSALDVLVVLANVAAVSVGGLWALVLAGLNLNISALVGFISILGVAVMNGLILVSSFNTLRAAGVPLDEAIRAGVGRRVRPLVMTLLTAILGLLPAALSTAIGSQSQRPLAVVVVGGMLATVVMFNIIPVLYSLYGGRTPPECGGELAH
jgi:cobalt-zinc-cadmium resistance protein CzcA